MTSFRRSAWAVWAEVYRARDTRLGSDVALKILAPDMASDPSHRQRFETEARRRRRTDCGGAGGGAYSGEYAPGSEAGEHSAYSRWAGEDLGFWDGEDGGAAFGGCSVA
jgi:hypothetical protein